MKFKKNTLGSAQAPTIADVCLVIEGAYPYVYGGVSSWVDQLIKAHSHLTFYIVSIVPKLEGLERRYEFPSNVLGIHHVSLLTCSVGKVADHVIEEICAALEAPLVALQKGTGSLPEIRRITTILEPLRHGGVQTLLDSRAAWDLLVRMYQSVLPHGSFPNYFWSWRSMIGSLLGVLSGHMPEAYVYHAISTGYAGLFAARAHLEKKRPAILTEHGIYSNERRIELTLADWLGGEPISDVNVKHKELDLRDIWINTFIGYARACYGVSEPIITLYEGNQRFQLRDGASADKLLVIPNGINTNRFPNLQRKSNDGELTIAFIGRVVPIKDLKTLIRACAILKAKFAAIRVLVMGPTDESPEYFRECVALVEQLQCEQLIQFLGSVWLDNHIGEVDIVVLTSLSEAQPLVVLEAGVAGIPVVATDVGACREMIMGASGEHPAYGVGGAITALASPNATAEAIGSLLKDAVFRQRCGRNLQARVRALYNKDTIDGLYRDLYASMISRVSAERDLATTRRAL